MKKAVLTVVMVAASMFAKAQTIQVDQQTTIWEANYSFIELRDDRQADKPWAFYLPFQNAEYQYTTDIGSIIFRDVDALKLFVSTCEQMLNHESKNLKVDGNGYQLNRYDFRPSFIYVTETSSGRSKYFVVNKRVIREIQSAIANL